MTPISQLLRNKVMLIQEPVASRKTVAIGFWFSTGSRIEPDNLRGVTHFVEHMLFKGTTSHSSLDIARIFDRMGGYVNAFTEREAVCLYCVVPSLHAEKSLKILCEMTSCSIFDENELQKERKVIKSEILSSQDDPEESALDAVGLSVWPNQKIGDSISGSIENVDSLVRNDLVSWYNERFAHGPLTVCISGTYDAQNICSILEELPEHTEHNNWSDKDKQQILLKQKPFWKSDKNFIKSSFQQEQIFLLFPLMNYISERQYFVFSILNALTGSTMSSRLFQRLREKGGYCYTVDSFFSYYEDAGCFLIYASSEKKEVLNIVSDIKVEIEDLLNHSITDEELAAAKDHVCGEEMIASEDVEFSMKRLARSYQAGYPIRTTEEVIEIYRDIKKAEIDEAIKLIFNISLASLVVFGPSLKKSEKNIIQKLF